MDGQFKNTVEYLNTLPLYESLDFDSLGLMYTHIVVYSGKANLDMKGFKDFIWEYNQKRLSSPEVGSFTLYEGCNYEGQYVNYRGDVKVPHGLGKIVDDHARKTYTGFFENGAYSGFGIIEREDQETFYGKFVAGNCVSQLSINYYYYKYMLNKLDEIMAKGF